MTHWSLVSQPSLVLAGVGYEQGMAEADYAEVFDDRRRGRRHQVIGESRRAGGVDAVALAPVDGDDAVDVQQGALTLDQHGQAELVLEGQVGAPIGERIRLLLGGDVEGRAHAGAGLLVPSLTL